MGAILSNILGGIYGYLIAAVVSACLSGAGIGYLVADHYKSTISGLELSDALASRKAVQAVSAAQATSDAIALDAAVREAQAQDAISAKNNTVTREITRYVTVKADNIACIPISLERVFRSGAAGLPDPAALGPAPSELDDTCAELSASALAGWFQDYATVAQKNAEQLNALEAEITADHDKQVKQAAGSSK